MECVSAAVWHQVFMTVGDTRKGHFPKLVRESLVRRVVLLFSKVWVEASETKIETLNPQFRLRIACCTMK